MHLQTSSYQANFYISGTPSPSRALFTNAFARFNSTAILLNKSPLLSLEDQDQASKCTFKMYLSTALAFAVSAMTVVSAVALPKPNVNVIIKVEVCTNPVLYYFCPIYPCIIWSPRPIQQHIWFQCRTTSNLSMYGDSAEDLLGVNTPQCLDKNRE